MKAKLLTIAATVGLSSLSQGAIALTGTATTGLGTLAPVGTLVLLTVDSTADGTLGVPGLSGDLSSNSVAPLTLASASITIGETFGGDLVLGRASVTSAGALPGGFSFDNIAALQGKRFSLIFLPSLTSASTNVVASTTYGVISGSDWILPAVNGGESFSFSSTDNLGAGSFFRVTVAAGVATNDSFASSSGANLTMVPEPSAALLGAIGALGLLRRRRI
jgi:hypothetical protein